MNPSPRKWRFTYGYSTTTQATTLSTDFWVETRASGEPSQLEYTLHGSWEYGKKLGQTLVTNSEDFLDWRVAIEKRLLALQAMVGRQGLLEIDYDLATPRHLTFSDVVCTGVSPVSSDSNLILEVDITFAQPSPGQVVRTYAATHLGTAGAGSQNYRGAWDPAVIYRTGDSTISSNIFWIALQDNRNQLPTSNAIWRAQTLSGALTTNFLIVNYDRPDQTQFKPVFRNAPIRIRAAKGMETITLTGIRQTVGGTDLARRLAAEAVIRGWLAMKGDEFLLAVDSVNYGLCHLSDAKASALNLPDAIVFDLTFLSGYVNG